MTGRLGRFEPRKFRVADHGEVQVAVSLDGAVKLTVSDSTGQQVAVCMEPDKALEVQQALRAKSQAASKEVRVR